MGEDQRKGEGNNARPLCRGYALGECWWSGKAHALASRGWLPDVAIGLERPRLCTGEEHREVLMAMAATP